MKRICLLLLMAALLTGCAEEEVFETVGDQQILSVMAQPREITLTLPEDTVLPAMETDDGILYMCREFDVMVQTMDSGDLEATIRAVSGFSREDLTVIETFNGEQDCYEFTWTAAGETEEQVCRCMILDDGNYHYVVTAMVDAELVREYQEIWNGMFETVRLV